MLVKQISVFLENKRGSLSVLTKLLADNQVNLKALSIADTQDFGILRLIAEDPRTVAMILSAAGYVCNVTEVLAVSVADRPGGAAAALAALAEAGITVEYAYAFASAIPGKADMVIRVHENETAAAVLAGAGIQ